jgi:hypothetical protein
MAEERAQRTSPFRSGEQTVQERLGVRNIEDGICVAPTLVLGAHYRPVSMSDHPQSQCSPTQAPPLQILPVSSMSQTGDGHLTRR